MSFAVGLFFSPPNFVCSMYSLAPMAPGPHPAPDASATLSSFSNCRKGHPFHPSRWCDRLFLRLGIFPVANIPLSCPLPGRMRFFPLWPFEPALNRSPLEGNRKDLRFSHLSVLSVALPYAKFPSVFFSGPALRHPPVLLGVSSGCSTLMIEVDRVFFFLSDFLPSVVS